MELDNFDISDSQLALEQDWEDDDALDAIINHQPTEEELDEKPIDET